MRVGGVTAGQSSGALKVKLGGVIFRKARFGERVLGGIVYVAVVQRKELWAMRIAKIEREIGPCRARLQISSGVVTGGGGTKVGGRKILTANVMGTRTSELV